MKLSDQSNIFIWLPKTGGTSFTTSLMKKDKNFIKDKYAKKIVQYGTYGHCDVKEIYNKKEILDVNFFCICRNPYDRLVSLYFYLKKDNKIRFNNFKQFVLHIGSNEIPRIGKFNVKGLSQANPQVCWVKNLKNLKVYKFENMSQIYSDFDIQEIKINTTNHKNYKFYYDSETLEIVNKIYHEDFIFFDYKIIR